LKPSMAMANITPSSELSPSYMSMCAWPTVTCRMPNAPSEQSKRWLVTINGMPHKQAAWFTTKIEHVLPWIITQVMLTVLIITTLAAILGWFIAVRTMSMLQQLVARLSPAHSMHSVLIVPRWICCFAPSFEAILVESALFEINSVDPFHACCLYMVRGLMVALMASRGSKVNFCIWEPNYLAEYSPYF
jgi:hypothetical protein